MSKRQENKERLIQKITDKIVHDLESKRYYLQKTNGVETLYRHFDLYFYRDQIRKIEKAELRKFPLKLAAKKIFNVIKSRLEDISASTSNILKGMTEEIKVDKKQISEEIKCLFELFDKVRYNNGILTAVTRSDIILEEGGDYETNFGKFTIVFNFESPDVGAEALTPKPCPGDSSITHPHVKNDCICTGDGYDIIHTAKDENRFSDIFIICERILQTYSPDSPHAQIESWHEEQCRCSECGDYIGSEDVYDCYNCGDLLCHSCCISCSVCDRLSCGNCYEFCETCENSYCNNHTCKEECKNCNKEICRETQEKCNTCDKECCEECLRICDLCQSVNCTDCCSSCGSCDQLTCENCIDDCVECEKKLCSDCGKDCDYCGEKVCENCETICCLFKEKENAGT